MARSPIIREPRKEGSHHLNPHDDSVETHYASLERAECPFCFRGYVTITVEEDGQEHHEAVPCKRCQAREDF